MEDDATETDWVSVPLRLGDAEAHRLERTIGDAGKPVVIGMLGTQMATAYGMLGLRQTAEYHRGRAGGCRSLLPQSEAVRRRLLAAGFSTTWIEVEGVRHGATADWPGVRLTRISDDAAFSFAERVAAAPDRSSAGALQLAAFVAAARALSLPGAASPALGILSVWPAGFELVVADRAGTLAATTERGATVDHVAITNALAQPSGSLRRLPGLCAQLGGQLVVRSGVAGRRLGADPDVEEMPAHRPIQGTFIALRRGQENTA
ncbi:MAG: hypothetical protein U0838_00790 [Chloroflexota bacterium]